MPAKTLDGLYFNPRPPRGGRHQLVDNCIDQFKFQSTPPARGATVFSVTFKVPVPRFQSTPPARGATHDGGISVAELIFQSTPPARGATPGDELVVDGLTDFNPRPPRGGRPQSLSLLLLSTRHFNPRPPRGGRRCPLFSSLHILRISIHAPREGGDCAEIG